MLNGITTKVRNALKGATSINADSAQEALEDLMEQMNNEQTVDEDEEDDENEHLDSPEVDDELQSAR